MVAMSIFPYAVAVWLFVIGLYGIVTSRNLIHLINCLSVAESSTYVLLLAIGYRSGATAPIFSDISPHTPVVDPIVQALTLTSIVVGAVVSALLLAIAIQAQKRFGTIDPEELHSMQG
jgi:multicomponent Na+:H+ antiporter subunit C